jgi:hypothetical protein
MDSIHPFLNSSTKVKDIFVDFDTPLSYSPHMLHEVI